MGAFLLGKVRMKDYFLSKYTHLTMFIFLVVAFLYNKIFVEHLVFPEFSIVQYYPFLLFFFFISFITILLKQKIEKIFPETKNGLVYVSVIFFATMILTYLMFLNFGDKYQTSLGLLISSVLVGSGWWVQATVSKVAARKSHTLNILMTQRNSDIFHRKSEHVLQVFGFDKTINEIIAKSKVCPKDKDLKDKKVKKKYKKAADDFAYILNYYEFICTGINKGDFDEPLMQECLGFIIPKLEKRGYYFIKLSRELHSDDAFDNLVKVVDRWTNSNSLIIKSESGNSIGELSHLINDESRIFDNNKS